MGLGSERFRRWVTVTECQTHYTETTRVPNALHGGLAVVPMALGSERFRRWVTATECQTHYTEANKVLNALHGDLAVVPMALFQPRRSANGTFLGSV